MDYNTFSTLSDEELQELLTGYALGALEADEMVAVDDYLQHHPELDPVVQRLADASTAFAYGVPQMAPPTRAKEQLMARVQADLGMAGGNRAASGSTSQPTSQSASPSEPSARQAGRSLSPFMRGAEQRPAPSMATPPPVAAPSSSRPATPAAMRRSANRRGSFWSFDGWFDRSTGWKVTTVASCAALLFFVFATTQLVSRLERMATSLQQAEAELSNAQAAVSERADEFAELEATVADLTEENSEITEQLASTQSSNDELQSALQILATNLETRQQQISTLLNVNQVVELDSTVEANARGALFVGEDTLILILSGLEPLPADQTYQLWLIPADSNPVSAGLVQVSDAESPNIIADIQLSTTSFAAVGLSIEQQGGSPSPEGPEGPVILLGESTT